MPMYDYVCSHCDYTEEDKFEPIKVQPRSCPFCEHKLKRATLEGMHAAPGVIGDEIDVTIKHGMCNADGTPKRWRSRQELKKATEKAGLVNRVEHKPAPGTDKNKHTQRFV